MFKHLCKNYFVKRVKFSGGHDIQVNKTRMKELKNAKIVTNNKIKTCKVKRLHLLYIIDSHSVCLPDKLIQVEG